MKKLIFVLVALLIALGAAPSIIAQSGVGSRVGGFPASPVFSGDVTIRKVNPGLTLDETSNVLPAVSFHRSGVPQWVVRMQNAGTDLEINDNATKWFSLARTTGLATFGGTLSSSKACATGHTRVLPNFCKAVSNTNGAAGSGWTNATACTSRAANAVLAVPADAKHLVVQIFWRALSNNAVALRQNQVNFYHEAACTNVAATSHFAVREQVAAAAGTTLAEKIDTYIIPVTGTNTFHTTQLNAGGNGNADVVGYGLVGYFD